jgi:hypothetical protein
MFTGMVKDRDGMAFGVLVSNGLIKGRTVAWRCWFGLGKDHGRANEHATVTIYSGFRLRCF